MDNQFLEFALQYAKLDWKIFPCACGQKIPHHIVKHGVKDATRDESQIRNWWKKYPNANIAVACGKESGIYVVDVDVKEAGDISGWNSLGQLANVGKVLPGTVKQNTPRGGAHFFFQTENPPANRNSFLPGIDIRGDGYYVVITPSIHPNGGQYEWDKDSSPWSRQLAVYPDFLRPTKRSPWLEPQRQSPPAIQIEESEILKRASLYLATCDPAIQGCAGHDKLLWAAVCMVHGFLLSDSQAFDLLAREYNPRCIPPWDFSVQKDDRDFRRKITEARKLTPQHAHGWLLNDDSYNVNTSEVMTSDDIEKLIENSIIQHENLNIVTEDTEEFRKEFDFLVQPTGLLGEICSWINATALRKQPMLTLGCALVFCGVLFGRKIRTKKGLRSNIYGMGVGKSSAGKAHAPDQIRSLCENTCSLDLIGGDDWASDSGLELRLSKYPATLFMPDEVGHLLANIKQNKNPHLTKIVPSLMKLYSAAKNVYMGKEYAEEGKQRTLIQPCCCIWGNATPERFSQGFSPEELHDGWLSRCLVFRTETKPPKDRSVCEMPPPPSICKQVEAWFLRKIEPKEEDINAYARYSGNASTGFSIATAMPPSQIVISATSEANEIFYTFDEKTNLIGISDSYMECLWDKGEENARKIALILAASENFNDPIITPAIADYACRLVEFLLNDFSLTIAPMITTCMIDAKKQKILAIIRKAGIQGCLKRDITRRTQWTNGRDREAMLADLIEAEEIIIESVDKKNVYRTQENFIIHMKEKDK